MTNLIRSPADPVQSLTDRLSVVQKYSLMTSRSRSLHRCRQYTVHLHKFTHYLK